VFDRYGTAVAAVGISGPGERVEPKVEEFARYVRNAARDVSGRYGALESSS
jgi:DNA-binding IclR family transcriptional regulator